MTDKCVLRSALFRKSECAIKLSGKTLQNLPYFAWYFVDMRTRFLISCCIIYCYFLKCYSRQLIWLFIFEFLKSEWLLPSKKRSSWPHTYKERIIWALMLQHPKNMARLHKSKQQPSANYFLFGCELFEIRNKSMTVKFFYFL